MTLVSRLVQNALPGRRWCVGGSFSRWLDGRRNAVVRKVSMSTCFAALLSRPDGWTLCIPPRTCQHLAFAEAHLPTCQPSSHQDHPNQWLPPLQCNPDAVVEVGGATTAQSCRPLRGGAGADPCSRSIPPLVRPCVPSCCMAFWCLAPSSPSHLRCATLSSLLDRTTPQTRGCQNNPAQSSLVQPSLQSDSERRRTTGPSPSYGYKTVTALQPVTHHAA